jgi:hydroxyacylglutathione hydrolase
MMKLTEHVYLVGSGHLGFEMTDPYDCNIYLIDGGNELALIDAGAGMGVPLIKKQIESHGFRLEDVHYLILTHAHGDHGGGAWVWVKEMPWIKVLGTAETKERLTYSGDGGEIMAMAKRHGYYPEDYMLHACRVDRVVEDNEIIQVGNASLRVIATPGHCDGHICLMVEEQGRKILLAGDMIFSGGRVSTQVVPDCRPMEYYRSVQRVLEEKIDVLLPAHYEFVLNRGHRHIELAMKYFMRLAIPPSVVT